jgi:hypothetical protein
VLEKLARINSHAIRPIEDEFQRDMMATAAATELQRLFTGFEHIVERHFRFKGEKLFKSEQHHKEQLNKVFTEGLVSDQMDQNFLQDLLGFRHMVRESYGIDFVPDWVFPKVKNAVERWPSIAAKLRREVGLDKPSS